MVKYKNKNNKNTNNKNKTYNENNYKSNYKSQQLNPNYKGKNYNPNYNGKNINKNYSLDTKVDSVNIKRKDSKLGKNKSNIKSYKKNSFKQDKGIVLRLRNRNSLSTKISGYPKKISPYFIKRKRILNIIKNKIQNIYYSFNYLDRLKMTALFNYDVKKRKLLLSTPREKKLRKIRIIVKNLIKKSNKKRLNKKKRKLVRKPLAKKYKIKKSKKKKSRFTLTLKKRKKLKRLKHIIKQLKKRKQKKRLNYFYNYKNRSKRQKKMTSEKKRVVNFLKWYRYDDKILGSFGRYKIKLYKTLLQKQKWKKIKRLPNDSFNLLKKNCRFAKINFFNIKKYFKSKKHFRSKKHFTRSNYLINLKVSNHYDKKEDFEVPFEVEKEFIKQRKKLGIKRANHLLKKYKVNYNLNNKELSINDQNQIKNYILKLILQIRKGKLSMNNEELNNLLDPEVMDIDHTFIESSMIKTKIPFIFINEFDYINKLGMYTSNYKFNNLIVNLGKIGNNNINNVLRISQSVNNAWNVLGKKENQFIKAIFSYKKRLKVGTYKTKLLSIKKIKRNKKKIYKKRGQRRVLLKKSLTKKSIFNLNKTLSCLINVNETKSKAKILNKIETSNLQVNKIMDKYIRKHSYYSTKKEEIKVSKKAIKKAIKVMTDRITALKKFSKKKKKTIKKATVIKRTINDIKKPLLRKVHFKFLNIHWKQKLIKKNKKKLIKSILSVIKKKEKENVNLSKKRNKINKFKSRHNIKKKDLKKTIRQNNKVKNFKKKDNKHSFKRQKRKKRNRRRNNRVQIKKRRKLLKVNVFVRPKSLKELEYKTYIKRYTLRRLFFTRFNIKVRRNKIKINKKKIGKNKNKYITKNVLNKKINKTIAIQIIRALKSFTLKETLRYKKIIFLPKVYSTIIKNYIKQVYQIQKNRTNVGLRIKKNILRKNILRKIKKKYLKYLNKIIKGKNVEKKLNILIKIAGLKNKNKQKELLILLKSKKKRIKVNLNLQLKKGVKISKKKGIRIFNKFNLRNKKRVKIATNWDLRQKTRENIKQIKLSYNNRKKKYIFKYRKKTISIKRGRKVTKKILQRHRMGIKEGHEIKKGLIKASYYYYYRRLRYDRIILDKLNYKNRKINIERKKKIQLCKFLLYTLMRVYVRKNRKIVANVKEAVKELLKRKKIIIRVKRSRDKRIKKLHRKVRRKIRFKLKNQGQVIQKKKKKKKKLKFYKTRGEKRMRRKVKKFIKKLADLKRRRRRASKANIGIARKKVIVKVIIKILRSLLQNGRTENIIEKRNQIKDLIKIFLFPLLITKKQIEKTRLRKKNKIYLLMSQIFLYNMKQIVKSQNYSINFFGIIGSSLTAEFIMRRIKERMLTIKQGSGFRIVPKIMKMIMESKHIVGFKFKYSGRLTGNSMAQKQVIQKGRVGNSSMRIYIDFAQDEILKKHGKCGMKLWIVRNVLTYMPYKYVYTYNYKN